MPTYVFDTSVLSAFASVERLDLLERRYEGAASWTVEVHAEISRGISEHPQLAEVLVSGWLGEPVRLYAIDQIEEVRLALGGKARPGDVRHLGEASTMVLAFREDHIVAVDDYDATRYARARGLGTINTIAILRACASDGYITPADAKALRDAMVDQYQRRLPEVTESDFDT